MNTRCKMKFWLILMGTWFSITSFSLADLGIKEQALFKIARSKDNNEIWYTINTDSNGVLITDEPVKVFWIKKSENTVIEPLTWIQNHFAYGIKMISSASKKSNTQQFQFVSYSKKNFSLHHHGNSYSVSTIIQNKLSIVSEIFVQIDGGTFWIPNITYVKLTGKEIQPGKEITETIIP